MAYVVRISDWSSDVCCSDLAVRVLRDVVFVVDAVFLVTVFFEAVFLAEVLLEVLAVAFLLVALLAVAAVDFLAALALAALQAADLALALQGSVDLAAYAVSGSRVPSASARGTRAVARARFQKKNIWQAG